MSLDSSDLCDRLLPGLRTGPECPSSSIAIWRSFRCVSTHFPTPECAFFRVSLTSPHEVFRNAADTSTIRTAVCYLFFLFSLTLLISHKSASHVFRPVRDQCYPGSVHLFNSPLVDRYRVIAFSVNFASIGRREMHRSHLIPVRSLRPCF
jgi:hypothetical protein